MIKMKIMGKTVNKIKLHISLKIERNKIPVQYMIRIKIRLCKHKLKLIG